MLSHRTAGPERDPLDLRGHEPVLRALAFKLCRDAADAGDLVQDTFERALRSQHRFTPGTNPRAWLCTILHNLFIDRCRTRSRAAPVDALDEVALPAAEPAPEPVWAGITGDQLREAVGRLEPEFRRVYELYTLERRSYQDIAAALEIPKNTVGTRLARARAKLRALLTAMAGEERVP